MVRASTRARPIHPPNLLWYDILHNFVHSLIYFSHNAMIFIEQRGNGGIKDYTDGTVHNIFLS